MSTKSTTCLAKIHPRGDDDTALALVLGLALGLGLGLSLSLLEELARISYVTCSNVIALFEKLSLKI